MANLPHDPIVIPPELEVSAISTNPDVSALTALFPPLSRIALEDLVGPDAANRQHAALEKRTIELLDRVNRLSELANQLDLTFMRRSAVSSKDGKIGIQTDMPCNGKTFTGLRDAIALDEPVTRGQAAGLFTELAVPTGAIMAFPRAIPSGWLLCDNGLYTAAGPPVGYTWEQLANLRIYLGTAPGDPVGSMRVPNYAGRVIIGAGSGAGLTVRVLGAVGGEEAHVLSLNEMAAHDHRFLAAAQYSTQDDPSNNPVKRLAGDPDTVSNQTGHADLAAYNYLSTVGANAAHNNMQPFAVANVAIKI